MRLVNCSKGHSHEIFVNENEMQVKRKKRPLRTKLSFLNDPKSIKIPRKKSKRTTPEGHQNSSFKYIEFKQTLLRIHDGVTQKQNTVRDMASFFLFFAVVNERTNSDVPHCGRRPLSGFYYDYLQYTWFSFFFYKNPTLYIYYIIMTGILSL